MVLWACPDRFARLCQERSLIQKELVQMVDLHWTRIHRYGKGWAETSRSALNGRSLFTSAQRDQEPGREEISYKPEHVVNLETGAIVDADVRPGDEHDTADLTERVLEVEARINEALEDGSDAGDTGDAKDMERVELVAANKGYFKLKEVWQLQKVGIATAISDPQRTRRTDPLSETDRAALKAARQVVTSKPGRLWLRRRSELVERSIQYALDCDGGRRTTLRGRENIRKRSLVQAACAHLSLLMRHRVGIGTARQRLAGPNALISALIRAISRLYDLLRSRQPGRAPLNRLDGSDHGTESR